MNTFLTADFLLKSDTAKALYHNHAAKMPIIDYHCHLNPQQVAENYGFADLTQTILRKVYEVGRNHALYPS